MNVILAIYLTLSTSILFNRIVNLDDLTWKSIFKFAILWLLNLGMTHAMKEAITKGEK